MHLNLLQYSGATIKRTIQVLLSFSVPLAIYSLSLRFCTLTELGRIARFNTSWFLVLTFFILFIAFRQKGLVGTFFGLTATLSLFCLPLLYLWNSGDSTGMILGGLLPWSDAKGYYDSARSVLNSGNSTMPRPLFVGWLSSVLYLTRHNLQMTIGILVAITALLCFLSARLVQQTFGPATGAFVATGLFLFYRPWIGATLSESIGLALGSFGFALLLQATSTKKLATIICGTLLVSVSMFARTGAIFLLPILPLWAAFVLKRKEQRSARVLLMTIFAIALAFSLNQMLLKLTRSTWAQVPLSNYSIKLYGLLTHTNARRVFQDHPEINRLKSVDERLQAINQLNMKLMRENPFLLPRMMALSLRDYWTGSWSIFYHATISSENKSLELSLRFMLMIGFLFCCYRVKEPAFNLILFYAAGTLLSACFIPVWDSGVRAYASSIVALYVLTALGFRFLIEISGRCLRSVIAKNQALAKIVIWGIPAFSIVSYWFWYEQARPRSVEVVLTMAAPGQKYVRVYWDDPQKHPDSFEQIAVHSQMDMMWRVKLEALRTKNARAKGSEVWIQHISTPEEDFDWSKAKIEGQPWILADNPSSPEQKIAIAKDDQPQTISAVLYGGDLAMRLIRTPNSGIVRITVNDETKDEDLYGRRGIRDLTFPSIVAGDSNFRTYKFHITATPWQRLTIVPVDNANILLKAADVGGKETKISGLTVQLDYVWYNKRILAVILTAGLFVLFRFMIGAVLQDLIRVPADSVIDSSSETLIGLMASGLVIFACVVGPMFQKAHDKSVSRLYGSCQSAQTSNFEVNTGSFLRLVDDDSVDHSRLPLVRLSDFRNGLKNFSPWLFKEPLWFRGLNSGTTIVDSMNNQYLIADSAIVPATNGRVLACGDRKRIGQYLSIFEAHELHTLGPR